MALHHLTATQARQLLAGLGTAPTDQYSTSPTACCRPVRCPTTAPPIPTPAKKKEHPRTAERSRALSAEHRIERAATGSTGDRPRSILQLCRHVARCSRCVTRRGAVTLIRLTARRETARRHGVSNGCSRHSYVRSHHHPSLDLSLCGCADLSVDPAGGPRSRRHRRPGRSPVRHGRTMPADPCSHIPRPGHATPILAAPAAPPRGLPRCADDRVELRSSHSSSSQTNAQNSASTAPEPSAGPVSSRPRIAYSPLDGHPQDLADVCPLV